MTFITRSIVDRFGHIFTIATVIGLPVAAAASALVWWGLHDLEIVFDDNGLFTEFDGGSSRTAIFAGLYLVLNAVTWTTAFAAFTHLFDVRDRVWSDALVLGVRRSPAMALTMVGFLAGLVVINVIGALLIALLPPLALPFVVAIVGAMVIFGVRVSLAPTRSALGDLGGPLRTSLRLTSGLGLALPGRLVLIASVSAGVLVINSIIGGLFVSGPEPGSRRVQVSDLTGTDPAAFGLTQLLSTFGFLLIVAIWAAGMLSIHHDLDPERDPTQPIDGPSTDGDALHRD